MKKVNRFRNQKIILFIILIIFSIGCKKNENNTPPYAGTWTSIGMGGNKTMCLDPNNNLYVPDWKGVDKWDGSKWTNLQGSFIDSGGIPSICSDAIGIIYIGQYINSLNQTIVAKWDGSAWSELSFGNNHIDSNYIITSMCTDPSNNVYVACYLEGYGNPPYVAKWNGSSWNQLGIGSNALNANGMINTICSDKFGNIYASGQFTDSSGNYYIAKWNGNTWSDISAGNSYFHWYEINSICTDPTGNLYVSSAGGGGQSIVAKWNGSTWVKLFDAEVTFSICTDNSGNLYATFNAMAGMPQISNVDKWDGSKLSVLGGSTPLNANNWIYCICADKLGNVYASGDFVDNKNQPFIAKFHY
jgi:hypothetical protein